MIQIQSILPLWQLEIIFKEEIKERQRLNLKINCFVFSRVDTAGMKGFPTFIQKTSHIETKKKKKV